MTNDNIIVAIISTVGAIITSYLAYDYGRRRPKKQDPAFSAIQAYERLLRDQQRENDRKSGIIDKLEVEVNKMQGVITTLREELEDTKDQNRQLIRELNDFKDEYKAGNIT